MQDATHREEDPLQHLAVLVRPGLWVKSELELCVIVLLEVEKDRCGLEDRKVPTVGVDGYWNTDVWVEPDEPWLLLRSLPDVDRVQTVFPEYSRVASCSQTPRCHTNYALVLEAILLLQLLKKNGDFMAIGCARGVHLDGFARRRSSGRIAAEALP